MSKNTTTDSNHSASPHEAATGILSMKGPRIAVADMSLRLEASVRDAIECIDRSGRVSLALVVDDEGRLLNTLTDGDLRRGLLAGVKSKDRLSALLEIKANTPHPHPVTALEGTNNDLLLEMMKGRAVHQIPVVDADGRVTSVVTLDDLLPEEPRALQAVVMAGGFGTRLRPLTDDMPKPMLPVGGRPLMEVIIAQLQKTGVSKIHITTHYQAEKIVDHFGNGKDFGVDIAYVNEDSPLGTVGALGLMEKPKDPVLVINGDILTDIDFRSMHTYHAKHKAMITVAVRRYEVQVPYGVVDCEGPHIRSLREKPALGFFVNAGIYLLEPSVYEYIPTNQHYNMTDLIEALLKNKQIVANYPVREYWLDIGQHADYERAQVDAERGKWR